MQALENGAGSSNHLDDPDSTVTVPKYLSHYGTVLCRTNNSLSICHAAPLSSNLNGWELFGAEVLIVLKSRAGFN